MNGNYDWYEGLPFAQLSMWGLVQNGPIFTNFYTDPGIQEELFVRPIIEHPGNADRHIDILDAGGGDGVLTELVIRLLLDHGYRRFSVSNVDNGSIMREAIRRAREISEAAISDRWINRPEELREFSRTTLCRFDYILSRFVMQYASGRYSKYMRTGQTQRQLLQSIYRVLKPGGLAIVVYHGARSAIEHYALQVLNSEILAIVQTGMMVGPKKQFYQNFRTRAFTDTDYFTSLAEEVGFKVRIGRELFEYKMGLGEEAYWDRFGKRTGRSFAGLRWAIAMAETSWEGLFKDLYGYEPERHQATGAIIYPTLYFQLEKPDG